MTVSATAEHFGRAGQDHTASPPPSNGKWLIACALLLVATLMPGVCTAASTDGRGEPDQANDPAEPVNRKIFGVNQFIDRNALQPVARSYTAYIPKRVRNVLHNFVSNLEQPAILVNDALQGNISRAWNTTQRFAVNTAIGGAGLFDVATDWHRPGHDADFGQTLGVWGVGPGPAVQLPLFGPSNARDSVGKAMGFVLDPTTYITSGAATAVSAASGGIGMVDGRARLLPMTDTLRKSSLDYYAALRSAAAQHRAYLVQQGKVGLIDGDDGEDGFGKPQHAQHAEGTPADGHANQQASQAPRS
jgi:phospholipid-binding lipoprotein MlaA